MLQHIKRGILLFFVLGMFWTGHLRAQVTFTVQPDASVGKDATISLLTPTTNNGTSTVLGAFVNITKVRSLVQFDLSSIPSNVVITSAMLALSNGANSGTNACYLSRVSASWVESTCTWNSVNSSFITTDQISIPTIASSTYSVDVTAHVQTMVQSPSANYGWMFRMQDENTAGAFSFASSDYTVAAQRPKLIVTYVPCPSPLTITVTPTPLCQGSTASLSVPVELGQFSFSWAGPTFTTPGFTNSFITTTTAGTYTVTHPVCGSATKTISFTAVPTLTASPASQTVCAGSQVSGRTFQISPSVNTVGTWTNSNTNIGLPATGSGNISAYTAPNVSTQQIGVITVRPFSNATGCTGSALTFTIVINPRPPVTMGLAQFITCAVSSPTITGSSSMSGVSYSWTPPGSAPTATRTVVSLNGTYSLLVTNTVTGCSTTSITTVSTSTTPPGVTASGGGTITCSSPSRTLTGSSSDGMNYTWRGPTVGTPAGTTPNTFSTSVSLGGTYTVTATNPVNGCSSTATIAVSSNTTVPNISVNANPSVTCTNTVAVLSGTSTTVGTTFAWTGTAVAVPAGTTPTQYSTAVTVVGNYFFTVTNPTNGCKSVLTRSVINNTAPPVANAGNTQYIISPATSTVIGGSPSASGGVSPYTYSWTPSTGLSSTTIANPTSSTTQSRSYTLTVTGANGCKASSSMYVILSGQPFYVVLQRSHDGSTYLTRSGVLLFKFEEEYTKQNTKLSYVVYDDLHQVVPSTPILPEVIGDNRYQLNLAPLGLIAGRYYSIEVSNEKKESWVARFIYK